MHRDVNPLIRISSRRAGKGDSVLFFLKRLFSWSLDCNFSVSGKPKKYKESHLSLHSSLILTILRSILTLISILTSKNKSKISHSTQPLPALLRNPDNYHKMQFSQVFAVMAFTAIGAFAAPPPPPYAPPPPPPSRTFIFPRYYF